MMPAPMTPTPIKTKPEPDTAPAAVSGESRTKRLICLHCNEKISWAEGRFCWGNSARFKGGQYCREHQALHR